MGNRALIFTFLLLLIPGVLFAQSDRYTFNFAPDAWYNEVDGIRLGARILGEMEGTFQDGPHRLDAGVWLGTAFPDQPVSYYLSFTEPIPAISSLGSEGNIQLESSIRTGYSQHALYLNKRWQRGFNELNFREVSVSFSQEKQFEFQYRPYPQLWHDQWKSLLGMSFWLSEDREQSKFDLKVDLSQNVGTNSEAFTVGMVELKEQIQLSKVFKLRVRGFGGYASDNTSPEFLFGYSYRQPVEWLNNGVSRAKGTLPGSWLNDGLFNISGGANLRGYTRHDFSVLESGGFPQYRSIAALNTEIEFPNFINSRLDKSIIGDFLHLRSYMFFDLGKTFDENINSIPGLQDDPNLLADAGLGIQFSINIPDYLGKDRGFAIRYEVPFWLSDPLGNQNNFKYRNLIGIGAVISL
ncbi:MAG: hypothetical protein WD053_11850 [Gracilimonas sp.]